MKFKKEMPRNVPYKVKSVVQVPIDPITDTISAADGVSLGTGPESSSTSCSCSSDSLEDADSSIIAIHSFAESLQRRDSPDRLRTKRLSKWKLVEQGAVASGWKKGEKG